MLTLTSYGGAGTVTGSKHLLAHGNIKILIDCGLFQGLKNLRELNWQPLPINPEHIDAVVLTHAHLDHSGYLPRLVREGFRGRIYATEATRDVAELILRDSAHLQEKDAEWANRKGFSRHKPAQPLYTLHDVDITMRLFKTVKWNTATELPGKNYLTFRRMGHILGAASADIEIANKHIVFSGDIGRYQDPVMLDPEPVAQADAIIIESTYGNRVHDDEDVVHALGSLIEQTIKRAGTVVIPAFAVGRAQSLIYYLWKLRKLGRLQGVPIFLDSPMATSASELLAKFPQDHRLSMSDYIAAVKNVTFVRDAEDSIVLSANTQPKVIISASGMATGGRVLHHIAAFASDPRNTLLFSGFQAAGTRGRKLLEGASDVRIHGRWVPVNAQVAELHALSAHADSNELMRWLSGFASPPQKVFVVHGEAEAAEALRERIMRELGWRACVPLVNQEFLL